jgi:hypothetical protein
VTVDNGSEAAMADQQHDHVGLGGGVLSVGQRHVAEVAERPGQRGGVRLDREELDVRQGRSGPPGKVDRRALAHIPGVGLEGQPRQGDARVAEPEAGRDDLLGGVRRHVVVYLARRR